MIGSHRNALWAIYKKGLLFKVSPSVVSSTLTFIVSL